MWTNLSPLRDGMTRYLDLDTVKEAFKPYCTEIVVVTTQENF